MYKLLGLPANVENVFALTSKLYIKEDSAFKSLKLAYKKFLAQIQPNVPISD